MGEWLNAKDMTVRKMIDLPPVWLMGFILLVWAVAQAWPNALQVSAWLHFVGAVLFWTGLGLMGWTIWTFRTHRTTVVPHQTPSRLITNGPFRYSRNPIYLGDLMVLTGVVLGNGALLLIWVVPLLGAILKRRFIAPEEIRMKQSFEAEFATYMQKTRRWL